MRLFYIFLLISFYFQSIEDPDSNKYVDGIAVHWYEDRHIKPEVLDETHDEFPEKYILYTEACEGTKSLIH